MGRGPPGTGHTVCAIRFAISSGMTCPGPGQAAACLSGQPLQPQAPAAPAAVRQPPKANKSARVSAVSARSLLGRYGEGGGAGIVCRAP